MFQPFRASRNVIGAVFASQNGHFSSWVNFFVTCAPIFSTANLSRFTILGAGEVYRCQPSTTLCVLWILFWFLSIAEARAGDYLDTHDVNLTTCLHSISIV